MILDSRKPRVGALIQARMGSSRFPGKVLEDLAGAPVLARVVDRLMTTPGLDAVVVATSDRPRDDAITRWCADHCVACFRGPENDVLGRFAAAAAAFELNVVVRACADAPLTDPAGIARLLEVYARGGTRYVHNRHPRGWPVGTAADLFTRRALAEAAREARRPDEREHVTPFLYERPERFAMRLVFGPEEWLLPRYHFAVDTPADLAWMRALFKSFRGDATTMTIVDVLEWIAASGRAPRRFDWTEEARALP